MEYRENYRETKKPQVYPIKINCTVQEFFDRHMTGKSSSDRRRMLAKGFLTVGGKELRKLDDLILAGQSVVVKPKPEPQFEMPEGLKIVYEDDWLLVVNKDPGLLTVATETEQEHTVYAYLSAYLKFYRKDDKVFIVHRIDRGTSGLLIFAKSEKIQRALRENWNENVVSRRYIAVVEGRMERDYGTVKAWLNEDPDTLCVYVCRPGTGKLAVTHYSVIKRHKNMTMLELELETGRRNQIRVHMKHLGHILVGDRKYGAHSDPIGRLCLHAAQIEFHHPMTGKVMNFATPIPKEFLALVND